MQHPGETLFVPHGMPHAYLDLDATVSVSESFLSEAAADKFLQMCVFGILPFYRETREDITGRFVFVGLIVVYID